MVTTKSVKNITVNTKKERNTT